LWLKLRSAKRTVVRDEEHRTAHQNHILKLKGIDMDLSLLLMSLCCLALGVVFTSKVLTDKVRIYDLVKMELDTRLSRASGKLKNLSATTALQGAIPVGYPVKFTTDHWETVLNGDEAATQGLWLGDPGTQPFLEQLAQNATSALPGQVLYAGPAIIDKDKIPATDIAGAALNQATIVTALLALAGGGIKTLAEPTISVQQTA
jgi:hypothetical protein